MVFVNSMLFIGISDDDEIHAALRIAEVVALVYSVGMQLQWH